MEVTLAAFFQLAQVLQPITVCVQQDTRDRYSSADFHRGYQQITAEQAVAFVRQRRDTTHPQVNFSDLDRERRQQAFIASVAHQLKQAGTLANPVTLTRLISVAKHNIVTDAGLDPVSLAQTPALTSGNITFLTLPITGFGTDPAGEDVNLIDVTQIQELTHQLLGTTKPAPAAGLTPPATVDAINATGRGGQATAVQRMLASKGFTGGHGQHRHQAPDPIGDLLPAGWLSRGRCGCDAARRANRRIRFQRRDGTPASGAGQPVHHARRPAPTANLRTGPRTGGR